MTKNVKDLPAYWPYLFATFLARGFTFKGKTKLNKYVSRLQREGFPIPNYFLIQAMGALDKDFVRLITKATKDGLLLVKNAGNGRYDYTLTESGKEYITEKVFPIINEEVHPKDMERAKQLMYEYEKTHPLSIVAQEHDILGIGYEGKFSKEISCIRNNALSSYNSYSKKDENYCERVLDITGMLEFIAICLGKIINSGDFGIGERNIKVNADYFLIELEKILQCHKFPTDKCKKEDSCSEYELCYGISLLKDYFKAIEWNAFVYGTLRVFNSREFDLERYTTERCQFLKKKSTELVQIT